MSEWVEKEERGSAWTIRLMMFLCKHTGQWLVRPLLYPIVAYFFLTSPDTRATSLRFFTKVNGHSDWRDCFKQLHCFAQTLLDRIFIMSGNTKRYQVTGRGREMFIKEQKRGKGMILLGSHLGSFEACRILIRDEAGLDVYMVAYFGGSKKIRMILEKLNPGLMSRIIDPTEPEAIFKMREAIESGGILAILGDRVGIGEKKASVRFFGEEVELPAGPYLLAHILGCPVYSFFGLLTDKYHYDSCLEPIAECIKLPRKDRQQALNAYAQGYADRLEYYCRKHPYNWFNFYDYWSSK
ncbi:MAG: hypothetical protein Q9M11_08500 [Mariprofundaceae bacterium]|nr:hypothetical protein [Mariprofundaceae bacterium]